MNQKPQITAVHFQFMKEPELAKKLFESGKPFLASIVPDLLDKNLKTEEGEEIYKRIHPEDNYYPEWAVDIFRENKNNPNVTWIQEGYRHCCSRCFNEFEKNGGREKNAWPDPFHEHVCLDGHVQNLEKQKEVIQKGKNLIEEVIGIIPKGYCPPNHMYNEDTLKAVKENKFNYFITRNAFDYFLKGGINFPVYEDNELIVIPETKLGIKTKTPMVSTYYDHLEEKGNWDNFERVLHSSVPLSKIKVYGKSKMKVRINEELIIAYKEIRDFKRKLNIK